MLWQIARWVYTYKEKKKNLQNDEHLLRAIRKKKEITTDDRWME